MPDIPSAVNSRSFEEKYTRLRSPTGRRVVQSVLGTELANGFTTDLPGEVGHRVEAPRSEQIRHQRREDRDHVVSHAGLGAELEDVQHERQHVAGVVLRVLSLDRRSEVVDLWR